MTQNDTYKLLYYTTRTRLPEANFLSISGVAKFLTRNHRGPGAGPWGILRPAMLFRMLYMFCFSSSWPEPWDLRTEGQSSMKLSMKFSKLHMAKLLEETRMSPSKTSRENIFIQTLLPSLESKRRKLLLSLSVSFEFSSKISQVKKPLVTEGYSCHARQID